MSLSNIVKAAMLNAYFGDGGISPPATMYVGLHGATTLAAGASSGASSISVAFDIEGATTVTIDPGGANEETHDIASVSGAGPYTVNLDGSTLANAHNSGVNVRFDVAEDGSNINEPSSGGYARVAIDNSSGGSEWNAATAVDPALVDNSVALAFPASSAAWLSGVRLTDLVLFDAASAGAYQGGGKLGTHRVVDAEGITLEFAAGELDVSLT